ncbi:MAG: DUF1947 domain-containing protein [Candidatus Bathyarchaeia archaeon]
MSKGFKRHFIRSKDAKRLLKEACEKLKIPLESLSLSDKVECLEADFCELFLVDKRPILFRVNDKIFPTLFFIEAIKSLPKAVVDAGAVPYICNGANVMAPGIIRFEGDFQKGDIIAVVDEKYGKPIAIGEVNYGRQEVSEVKHGAVVKTIHFVGDKIWVLGKNLTG